MKNKIGLSITLAILILTISNIIIYMVYDRPLHLNNKYSTVCIGFSAII